MLKPEWEWNYQPRADKWSLTERPGFLRLYAFQPLQANNFKTTGNVITQRALRTRRNEVTVKLDLSGMVDGQESGLAHFAQTYCTAGITQTGGIRALNFNDNGRRVAGPSISGKDIYFRSIWGFDGKSQFFYSADGHIFQPFGDPYQLTWGAYRGDRVGIFTVNSKAAAGYLDIDSFEYAVRP